MDRHSLASRGFTLAEMLIAIAVAAVLLGIAAPSFTELVERQKSWAAMNDLRTSLHQARAYAIRQNMQVTVCRSADSNGCFTGNRWDKGWIVFEDPQDLERCTVQEDGHCSHGGRVLSTSPGIGGGLYITANFYIRDTVRFYPTPHNSPSNGTFTACSADGEILRGMVVSRIGRIRVAGAGDSTSC